MSHVTTPTPNPSSPASPHRWSHHRVPPDHLHPDQLCRRGSVLVEAAMIFPILMLITFGIIEFGMAYGNAATVSSATRSGARLGATGYTPAADKRTFVTTMGVAVRRDLSALSSGTPQEMWVYRATAGVPTACTAANRCWLMTWNTTTKSWSTPSGGWSDPNACGTKLDSVGVYVKAQHRFFSGFFGSTKVITYRTTIRVEPLPSDQCL